MSTLNSLKKILIGLIVTGCSLRTISCAVRITINPDDKEVQKKRMMKAIIFMAVSVGITELTDRVISYFGIGTL